MKKYGLFYILFFILVLMTAGIMQSDAVSSSYDPNPPFNQDLLERVGHEKGAALFEPRNRYNIFINYELGMHCVGFDVSYCCVIPPYNSVQAQAFRAGENEGQP